MALDSGVGGGGGGDGIAAWAVSEKAVAVALVDASRSASRSYSGSGACQYWLPWNSSFSVLYIGRFSAECGIVLADVLYVRCVRCACVCDVYGRVYGVCVCE